jgi:hypothetical protein
MILLAAAPGEIPPLRRLIIPFLFVAALFYVLATRGGDAPFKMVILSGQTMGTTYAVKIVIPTEQAMNAQGISDRIESRLLAIQ